MYLTEKQVLRWPTSAKADLETWVLYLLTFLQASLVWSTTFTLTGSILAKKKRVKRVTKVPGGKAFQTEGTGSAKSLVQELTWGV